MTPEYLLSGVTEDSSRGKNVDYMVIPKDTEERILLEQFGELSFDDRARLLAYAEQLVNNRNV